MPLLIRFRALSLRRRLLVLALSLAVAYGLLGFLLVPWMIKRQIPYRAPLLLHRQATLAKARFNPFSLKTSLIGFDLRDRDGTPLLAFDTLVVNFAVSSIWQRAWVLDEFRLVRPLIVARVTPDGRPAIADLLASDTTAQPGDTSHTVATRLVIHRLGIESGAIQVVDQSRTPALDERFTDMGLTADELSTLPRNEGDHRLSMSFSSGATIVWSGRNSFDPLRLDGLLNLNGLNLPNLSRVLGGSLPFHVLRGVGQMSLHYLVDRGPDGALRISLPSGDFTAGDVAIAPGQSSEEWVRTSRFEALGFAMEWPDRKATLKMVRITDPWVLAGRNAKGLLNWSPYLDSLQQPDSTPPSNKPWNFRLDAFELRNGSATLTDSSVRPAVRADLSRIEVRAAPISLDSTVPIVLSVEGLTGKTGVFTAHGQASRSPTAADIDLSASGLDLTMLNPYLGAAPPATVATGVASLQGKFRQRTRKPMIVFDGRAGLNRFSLNDSTKAPLIAWAGMKVDGIHYTGTPDLLRIKKVTLTRPFSRIAISRERTVNLASLSRMFPEGDTTAALPYEVLEIAIADGSIDFSDESLILPFRATIDSTSGSIRDVASFGGAAGSVELEGVIAPHGLARINGTLQATDPYAATNIRLDIRNVDMPTLTPYSAQFAGYSITQGRLDLDLNYRIQNRQLQADHHIVATDLALGDKVEGGESPGFLVKLAISLLKDRDGKIKLDVPVTGTVDDPEFSYRGIVWKAVKQILGKIATAPFRFLGKLLGIGGDDIDLVDFDPGRTDLIPPEKEKLDSLAAELGRKPELTLSIEGHYDSISDAAALREARLQALITARRDSLGKKAQDDTSTTMMARILEQLYTAQFSAAALDSLKARFTLPDSAAGGKPRLNATAYLAEACNQLMARQPVDPGQLEQLGRGRAEAIAAALAAAATLDSTRVTVTDPTPVKRKKQGSALVPSELKMDAK